MNCEMHASNTPCWLITLVAFVKFHANSQIMSALHFDVKDWAIGEFFQYRCNILSLCNIKTCILPFGQINLYNILLTTTLSYLIIHSWTLFSRPQQQWNKACWNSPHEEMFGIVSVGLITMSYIVGLIVQSSLFANVHFIHRKAKTMPQ